MGLACAVAAPPEGRVNPDPVIACIIPPVCLLAVSQSSWVGALSYAEVLYGVNVRNGRRIPGLETAM